MQNAAAVCSAERRDDDYRSVVASLVCLIGHVQASIALVETTIARAFADGNQEAAAEIFVLDDVTPRFENVHTALKASDAGLGAALQFILDIKFSGAKARGRHDAQFYIHASLGRRGETFTPRGEPLCVDLASFSPDVHSGTGRPFPCR